MSSSFCRLCAKIKSQRSLKTTINDPSACIKKKLIDCCRWNSFTDDEKLPQHVCNSCIKKLEQSWEFAEIIATSQTVLYKMLITESNEELPNVLGKDDFDANNFHDINCPIDIYVYDVKIETEIENEIHANCKNKKSPCSQPEKHSQSLDNNELLDNTGHFIEDDCIRKTDADCLMKKSAKIDMVDGKFEGNEFLSTLSKDVCNSDGSITAEGVLEMKITCWNDYHFKCEKCSIISSGLDEYKFHIASKHPNKRLPFICFDCPKRKRYSVFGKFANHVAADHRYHLKYCCSKCQKFYWDLKLLKTHVYNHYFDEHKYKCHKCGKSFRRNYILREHYSNSHLPKELQNKCVCDICKKAFGKKENLRLHMLIHSGLRQHTCDQCGRSFTQKINLQHHILTHTKDRLFSCELCDKTFKQSRNLNLHKKVHTDIRPHNCSTCAKAFRESYHLKEHMRVHTGELPYACEYCEKKFRTPSALVRHRYVHTGERPYSCNECKNSFVCWSDCRKHMKRRHGTSITASLRGKKPSSPVLTY